ncbi:MAG: YlqD family protein [Vampirovibrionales bacterium]
MQALASQEQITVQRDLTVKTMVTDGFREKAMKEDHAELSALDANIQQLRESAQGRLNELVQSNLSNEDKQLAQMHLQQQFDEQVTQFLSLKQEVLNRQEVLANTPNGTYVSTGNVTDSITLNVGDNIYDRLKGAEILVKDGVITAILG